MSTDTLTPPPRRVADLDWDLLYRRLEADGFAQTHPVYSAAECGQLIALFDDDARFRSTIDMGRYRFGQGQYRYFDAPLPALIDDVRRAFYPPLAKRPTTGRGGSADHPAFRPSSSGSSTPVTAPARCGRHR